MTRFAAILAGVALLPLQARLGLAADPPRFAPQTPRSAEAGLSVSRQTAAPMPRYSYFGEYQYPVPFGYGYGYAPVRSRGFEYGYYGPRYVWSGPD